MSGDDNAGPRRSGRSSLGQASATPHGQPIRVVTVDDHLAVRKGLERLLEDEGFHVAGAAADASHAYDLLMAARPDVAVVDLLLPGESGAALTKRVLAKLPDLRIILYTGSEDSKLLREGLDCGARGFVLKAGPPEELMAAVRTVAGGGEYVDRRLHKAILGRETTEAIPELSPREREMLHHLAHGLTGEEIAQEFFLSPETVRTHVRNAMAKLEASTRVHAVVIALRQGEIKI